MSNETNLVFRAPPLTPERQYMQDKLRSDNDTKTRKVLMELVTMGYLTVEQVRKDLWRGDA